MPDLENENELRALVRRACKPVRASLLFREGLYDQILQEIAITQQGCMRILGLRPSAWVTLGAGIAVCLIIYGVLAVPDPSASVIIDSAPVAPHSFLATPGI